MTEPLASSENPARERHWVYGFNAVLLVAIGTIVLAFLFYFANRSAGNTWATYDWSSSGLNSLSGSTQRLLKEVDAGKQTFKLYSLFPPRSDIEKRENLRPEQDEHRRQVLDLLQQYARRSKNITFEDYGDRSTEEVRQEIYSTFATEIKPYKETVEAFDPLATKIIDFLGSQAEKVGIAGQSEKATPEQLETTTELQAMFKRLPDALTDMKKEVRKESDSTVPRWGELHANIQASLSNLLGMMSTLSDKDQLKRFNLPPGLQAYFSANAEQFKAIFTDLKNYMDKLTALKPLKSDEVMEALRSNSVVVLANGDAKVLSSFDLYPQKGDNPTRNFNGEQAISSALLAIVRPEKVKVVFVGLSPRSSGAFSDVKQDLKDANFDPLDWSPPAPQMPGAPPPQDATDPPAIGKGVVWIVFTPEADMQAMQMGMPGTANPEPILNATRKHMEAGGQVLFLAEASVTNPAMGLMAGPFPYGDLIKDFGIDVMSKYALVTEETGRDRDTGQEVSQTLPFIEISRYEPHEITTPMQSLPMILGPARSQMPSFPTVVTLHNPLPANAEAKILIYTPANAWGESEWSITAKFDAATDMKGPLPVAAVATRNRGQKDKEQRIAVIGSKQFAADDWLESVQPVMSGGNVTAQLRFPGNSELMKNTVLWLAGYENMIAVSAKANQAARIGDMSANKLLGLRIFIVAGVPLLALLLGGAVYMTRRR